MVGQVVERVQEASVTATGRSAATNTGRINALQSSNAVGEALGDVAQSLDNMEVRRNETRSVDAENEYNRRSDDILFNSENAYYGLKGQNAVNSREDTEKQLQELRKEISSGLDNNRQRKAFGASADRRFTNDRKGIALHSRKEFEVWDGEASAARIKQAQESARVDPSTLDEALDRINKEIGDRALKNGDGSDVTRFKLEQNRSSAIKGSIDQSIERGDLAESRDLLKRYGGKMSEGDRASVTKSLKDANKSKNARLMADKVLSMTRPDGKRLNRNEMNEQIAQIADDEERALTQKLATADYNRRKIGDAEIQARAFEDVQAEIRAGVPWEVLTNRKAWKAMSTAKQIAVEKAYLKGEPIKTSLPAYGKWAEIRDDETLSAGQKKVWLNNNIEKFSQGDAKKALDDVNKPEAKLKPFKTAKAQVTALVGNKLKKGSDRQIEFDKAFGEWYSDYQTDNKKNPTDTEVMQKADDMLRDVARWIGYTPAFEKEAERMNDTVDDAVTVYKQITRVEPDLRELTAINTIINNYRNDNGKYPSRSELRGIFSKLKAKAEE